MNYLVLDCNQKFSIMRSNRVLAHNRKIVRKTIDEFKQCLEINMLGPHRFGYKWISDSEQIELLRDRGLVECPVRWVLLSFVVFEFPADAMLIRLFTDYELLPFALDKPHYMISSRLHT